MSILRPTLLTAILLALLAGIAVGWPALAAQDPEQDRQWQAIVALDTRGLELWEQETASPPNASDLRRLRVAVFGQARFKVEAFVLRWHPDPRSIGYLLGVFRAALYAELSDQWTSSLRGYGICYSHPKLRSSGAKWKNVPLLDVLEGRWKHVLQRIEARPPPTDGISTVAFYHEKGIDPEAFKIRSRPGHLPLEASQIAAITDRLRASSPDRTTTQASALMMAGGIAPHQIEVRDDVVVVGAYCDAGTARSFADELVRVRARLRVAIGLHHDVPVLRAPLIVYANLASGDSDQESQGGKLALAVHGRSRDLLEGYFEPLDHSLVLRRGLLGLGAGTAQPAFFMGTPSHELAHALIADDFPDAPRWLDEGIASLVEAIDFDRGPLDNYRLYFVREGLKTRKLPSIAALVDPSLAGWDGPAGVLLCAASRYFCMYLHQLQGDGVVLRSVYARLRDAARDGAPVDSLAAIQGLCERDLAAVQKSFEEFVEQRDVESLPDTFKRHRSAFEHVVHEYISPTW